MRAVVIEKPVIDAKELKPIEKEKPTAESLQKNQLLVKNQFVGVNFIDIYMRRGEFGKGGLLGKEGCGKIIASKDERFKEGECVVYLSNSGSYAEVVVIDSQCAAKINPEDSKTMASFLLQGMTAVYLTENTYKVKAGDNVLVPAAAGGTGSLVCQAAKAKGARVIGLVGTKGKEQEASKYCDKVINYKEDENWPETLRKECPNGIQVAYDGVGKSIFKKICQCFGPQGGTLANFGMASGPINDTDCPPNVKIVHDSLFNYCKTDDDFKKLFSKANDMLKSGALKPKIYKVFKLEEVGQAHAELEGQKTMGKILLGI